ncbi:hypothetical protein ACJD0Z_13080 [Flavobacteriaceae bacterium M23B6Z8]
MNPDISHLLTPHLLTYCFSFESASTVSVYIDKGLNELWAKVDGKMQLFNSLPWKYKAPMFFEIQGNKNVTEALQSVSASKAVELYIKAIYIYQDPSFLN